MQKILEKTTQWLNIKEIEESVGLKLISFFLVFSFVLFLTKVYRILGASVFHTTCHPFFQNCSPWQTLIFLNFFPEIRPVYLTIVFSILFLSVYFLIKENYKYFYFSLLITFLISLLPMFIVGGYHKVLFTYPEQYLFFVILIFLFTPKFRIFFLQLFFILTYFYATISKFGSDSWLLGMLKLQFISPTLMPFATNAIILLQLCVPILLISRIKKVRILTVVLLELFHLYTVSFIGITFFCITSPFIFILFYNNYEEMDFRNLYKSIPGFLIILVITYLNFLRIIIPGPDYLTFEGSYVGFNMYHSQKGCQIKYQDKNLVEQSKDYKDANGNQICDPYSLVSTLKENCGDSKSRYLTLNLMYPDKTYGIINTSDYCSLKYNAFQHNSWINPKLIKDHTEDTSWTTQIFNNYKNWLILFYEICFWVIFLFIILKTKLKCLNF